MKYCDLIFGICQTPKAWLELWLSFIAVFISFTSLIIAVRFASRSFRPIVTAMVKTHASGNLATIFDLEIMNSGSIPAKNIRLKAQQSDIDNALGQDSTIENKDRWLRCFKDENIINILQNNSSVKCSFGQSKATHQGFWKYKANLPITIEYEGWFGRKYIQNQNIQIIDSNSFTGYHWAE